MPLHRGREERLGRRALRVNKAQQVRKELRDLKVRQVRVGGLIAGTRMETVIKMQMKI
jgi:hypothetical protein